MPPHERARAVSLATSGMYLGSAGAMLALPALTAWRGPGRVLQFNAGLGLLWLASWTLGGRDVPHRRAGGNLGGLCLHPHSAWPVIATMLPAFSKDEERTLASHYCGLSGHRRNHEELLQDCGMQGAATGWHGRLSVRACMLGRELMMPMSLGEPARGGKGRVPATPWGRMLRHPALWAIVLNNFTFHYAFYVVMNWLPTYFDRVPRC